MQKSSFLKKMRFKLLDLLILVIFIAFLAVSVFLVNASQGQKASVIITTPFAEYLYDLNQDKELKIKGLVGISIIKIENGTARFLDSPCPNKTCVANAPISSNMEWSACLPNQVFVRISRTTEEDSNATDASSF